jgi:Restriction endonuclease
MINTLNIKKPFKVLVSSQWNKKEKGDFFEDLMAPVFKRQRWDVTSNVAFEGMQVDILLDNLDTSEKGLVECKFQEKLIEAPILYKLLGQALAKGYQYAFLVSTSELTATGKATQKNFGDKAIKLIVWAGEKLTDIFMDTYNIKFPDLNDMGVNQVNTVTLLVTSNS